MTSALPAVTCKLNIIASVSTGSIDNNTCPFLAIGDSCLLYTSDAADERSSVDLGGRRIIKKKKNIKNSGRGHIKPQKHVDFTSE